MTSEPTSHCVRCGKPTPLGVSLCEADNPGHIKAPSATQVHGTMLLGVGIGIVGFLILAQLAVRHAGPFTASVVGHSDLPGGAVEVQMMVVNGGASASIATCRITRDGTPRADDYVFRTDPIAGGGSTQVVRDLPDPPDPPPYDPQQSTITCT
jgi:predicted nucleic acid-binding Zn ribbon protein